jgi:hypothetical protein
MNDKTGYEDGRSDDYKTEEYDLLCGVNGT